MKKYEITNQKDLRKRFWQYVDEIGDSEMKSWKRTVFTLDANMFFTDWKDMLNRDGVISDELCFRALLY